jgi:hypothetical protein
VPCSLQPSVTVSATKRLSLTAPDEQYFRAFAFTEAETLDLEAKAGL